MRKSIWLDFLKLIAVFLALWVFLVFIISNIPVEWRMKSEISSEVFEISMDDEKKLGDFLLEMYLEDQVVLENSLIDSGLHQIEARLLRLTGDNTYDINFIIIKSEAVNAMTFPGGNIIIHSALIDFCENPEELASVIAHELAHVYNRDVLDKILAEVGMTLLVTVITGGDASIVHEIMGTLLKSVFSRSQESEADAYGLILLEDAEIDPQNLGVFFERLNENDLGYDAHIEFLMSHPHNDSRIKTSSDYEVKDGFSSRPLDLDWGRIKSTM